MKMILNDEKNLFNDPEGGNEITEVDTTVMIKELALAILEYYKKIKIGICD